MKRFAYYILINLTNMKTTLVSSILMFISILVLAQDLWTAEKIMEYKSLRDTEISEDSKYIAYVVRQPVMEEEKSEYNSQIWVAAADGSFNVQYTRGDKSATSPKFSPDGQSIAFLSDRNEKKQVWAMRLMGGEPQQITDAKKDVSSFKWSPDGKTIAYLMSDPDTEEEEKRKKEKRDVILVDKNFKYNHLYTVSIEKDAKGQRTSKRLTGGPFHVNSFDWSPDNKQVVFSHAPEPTINQMGLDTDISLVPADSGEVTPLVQRAGVDANPVFSPDGQWIAFTSHGGQPERVGLSDIYKIPVNGGEIMELQKTPDRNAGIVSWSNDGNYIFVTEAYKTSRTLLALPSQANVSPLTGDKITLSASGLQIISSLDGTAVNFSISKSTGKMSYIYQDQDTPAEVYISDLKGEGVKKISVVNANFNPPKNGKTELISWKSFDGLEIEGLLTYPVDYVRGKKYPIVLQIHGGPAGVYTKTYTGAPSIYMTQLFAQKGYILLKPNPRGSSGYGKDFRYANIRDWGFGDYQDLMTGVDHVIDMGIADQERQFVMGWSYGGYMTSWVVTQTDRFKAASMGAGLPNLISMVTTTDIPDYIVAHMGGKEFWEDYEEYEKHSAIYQIKSVKTPTQVIHGANDLRVPFTQGQEFYFALKRMGVDTEMIVYPRTPHGPREPKFLMDVSPRILAWFDKYK